MDVSFVCPDCQSKLKFDAASYPPGTEIDCPNCSSNISIPRPNIGPGTTIGGFELKKLLGKGGMGEVYLATQRSMHRDVALKILPSQFAMQEGAVDRFLQEVRMAARLNHPNIVRAYEAGEDHGVYFLAMDFVAGTSIDDRLRDSGAMPEAEVRVIAEKLGRALDQIWEKHRMIHRDIKPANIMLDEYGEPLLMDMGLSKALDDADGLTVSKSIMGSPNYMSPEQSEGAVGLDFRTDMYSLVATFYHMLTGKVPFKGKSVMEILRKQATEQLPDPRTHNPDISDGMVRIIERMMAKRAEDRYPSWHDFLKDLESLVFGAGPASEMEPGESVMIRAEDLLDEEATEQPSGGSQSRKPLFIGIGAAAAALIAISVIFINRPGADAPTPQSPKEPVVETGPSPTEILTSPDWEWTEPENLKNLNSSDYDAYPTLSADGLILIFASDRPGASGKHDLWEASRDSIDSPFEDPKPLGAPINTDKNEFVPWISADGLSLLFSRESDGQFQKGNMWRSTRESRTASWSQPVLFGPPTPADKLPRSPALSPDGKELLFEMDNGKGLKIHLARRPGLDQPFGPFIELGPEINQHWMVGGPKFVADGRAILFWRSTSQRGYNVHLALRSPDGRSFQPGSLLPDPPNSLSSDMYPTISGDGRILVFNSERAGGLGKPDLWMSRRVPRKGASRVAPKPAPVPTSPTVRVACVGDSITFGTSIEDRMNNSYPARLQQLLGDEYRVQNFGVSGATLLKKGDFPYWRTPELQRATEFNPNIVVIKLGTNDSKPQNWRYGREFGPDLLAMVEHFEQLPAKPRIYLCYPVPIYEPRWGISANVVAAGIPPVIRQVAKVKNLEILDLYTPLTRHPEWFPDKIHPNAHGAAKIAETVSIAIKSKAADLANN